MEADRRFLKTPASVAIGMLAAAVAFGGATVGLFVLAEHVRDSGLLGRLLALIGFYLAVGGALIVMLLLLMAVLGPNLTAKLFFVPNKMLTPQAVRDLTAMEAAPATVLIAPGQGVLRVIPVKPWWLDEGASADVAVPAGAVDVVAWVSRRDGGPGRRVRNSIPVSEGRVGALVFRPSSLPELPGTVESLNSELTGNLSMFRLAVAAAALIGSAYAAWQLAAGQATAPLHRRDRAPMPGRRLLAREVWALRAATSVLVRDLGRRSAPRRRWPSSSGLAAVTPGVGSTRAVAG